jgi:hypothetical protein
LTRKSASPQIHRLLEEQAGEEEEEISGELRVAEPKSLHKIVSQNRLA